MAEIPIFQCETDLQWEDVADGIQRQIVGHDQKIMLVKVKFEKGSVGELHSHHHSQVSYVDSGVFETNIDGQIRILKRGDGFYIPPDQVHGVICKVAGILIDAFSPPREDFLGT